MQVPDLFQSLLLTVSGTSSHLHIWDAKLQRFVPRHLLGKNIGQIVIVGKDEVVSERSVLLLLTVVWTHLNVSVASLLRRFCTIGNLMRRLDILAERPETRYFPFAVSGLIHLSLATRRRHSIGQSSPILHAFSHSLLTILAYLRHIADSIPPELQTIPGADARLTALWTRYEDMQHILQALASLTGRVSTVSRPSHTRVALRRN